MKPEARVDRCRVRDLVASCFNTCRLPLQDEEVATTTSDEAAAMKANKASSHNSRRLAEPRFADEDYIVFCFGEDGKIHMINNDTISTSTAITAKNEVDEQPSASKMESSFESCDSSSVSDTSTSSSFAFPLVGMEWIGSPLHMPKEQKQDAYRRCSTF
ncbi:uncharacterized protein LOC125210078 [Salvia hispanica]|uniref:uncharacterized protein LOC125210078 n=1 Tax=Salvia hispanica TaxID=49212 RepID=UPI0020097103|nr:uncharacterized protein LOC125210078 [Salvia hispanica]